MCGLEKFQYEGELVVEPGAKESVVATAPSHWVLFSAFLWLLKQHNEA